MEKEKVKEMELSVEEQLHELEMSIEVEETLKAQNLQAAAKAIQEEGICDTRRVYFQMCLKFASDPENDVDEDDITKMMMIHELLNVM